MKPIKTKFIEIKKILTPIEITIGPILMDVSEMFEPPEPGRIEEFPSLVINETKKAVSSIEALFSQVRDEILSNLSKTIEISDIKSYLQEIMNFYSELEERIVEDEFGKLSTDLVRFVDTSLDSMLEFNKNEYERFLKILKDNLRTEIQYVINQNQQLGMKKTNPTSANRTSDADIIWKRKKNDLIELVRALKLIGAINNSTNNISFDQAYKFFGEVFNIELKRPEDQLREASESYETPYFLEELLNIYIENQEILKKKRKSKSHPTSKQ